MSGLHELVQIKTTYTRSINLERDGGVYERVASYLPTSRALTALSQIAEGLHTGSANRALALIGPYGAGKSAFALFLGALLSNNPLDVHLAALDILESTAPDLADRISQALYNGKGYLRVQINGIPDSLVRQVLRALAFSVERAGLSSELAQKILQHAEPGQPIDQVLSLFGEVQSEWADHGGHGVLLEIDELGKFLEYESHHPQFREIHLLQLLAEHAQSAHRAPLHLVVMLHQAFEHYSHRLGKSLREEWQKVQGRFTALAFLEPAEQSLRIIGTAFQRQDGLPREIDARLDNLTKQLSEEDALPAGLDENQARELFGRCYPLHPLSLLILPVLCQKVAQNERTLFSYLGSNEPHGFCDSLGKLRMGEWIEPCELYDYFMLNPTGGFTDPLTYHRWIEVATALERLDSHPDHHAVALLKTIGLLNLIGAQRGLKASRPLLETVFGAETEDSLAQLQSASIIHYRQFSQEYRVWQGSDFDLAGALRQAATEYAEIPLDNLLNSLAQIKPIVARRATIATGSLRGYVPVFASRGHWPAPIKAGLILWFYLAESDEQPDTTTFPPGAVVAVCDSTERLRSAMAEWIALLELPKMHAVLHQDPVAQREHRAWLMNAETEALHLIHSLLGEPESPSLRWYWSGSLQGKL